MADRDLHAALVERAQGHRDEVPVFRTMQPSKEESLEHARSILAGIWNLFGECPLPWENTGVLTTSLRLPYDGRVDVFHPSGAIGAVMHAPAARAAIATDDQKTDRRVPREVAERAAASIARHRIAEHDELRFESVWERKGQGVTLDGKRTPVALFEVLVAFRRYLHGMPVLGRASVHVGVGGGSSVTRWGIDWRRVRPEPIARAAVVDPGAGATRVLDDLWWRRPERPFTLDDFEPRSFTLGYLSFPRRREQFVMQPAWVAVLAPRGRTSMGVVVAVPALSRAFEPIDRRAALVT